MQTPPRKVYPDDVKTVTVNRTNEATPKLDYSEITKTGTLGEKRNLNDEFEKNADTRENRLGQSLEKIKTTLGRKTQEYLEGDKEYNDRVKETAEMTFKLPAKITLKLSAPKRQKTDGGRKSSKRNKKHRKKTSKTRRSRK